MPRLRIGQGKLCKRITRTTVLIARISKNHLRLHFLLEKLGRKYSLSEFGFFAQLFKQKSRTQLEQLAACTSRLAEKYLIVQDLNLPIFSY